MKVEIREDAALLDGAVCDAAQLEKLIDQLLVLRARTAPAVPDILPDKLEKVVQREPRMEVIIDEKNRITLALRHGGLGWCVFTLSTEQARFLRDAVIRRLELVEPDTFHGFSLRGTVH